MTPSHVISNFNDRIKYATKLDPTYEKIRQHVRDGSTRKYWLEDDLLVDKGGRLCIPGNNLGKKLLKETYDKKWIGYPSEEQNLALHSRSYYWLKMGYGG